MSTALLLGLAALLAEARSEAPCPPGWRCEATPLQQLPGNWPSGMEVWRRDVYVQLDAESLADLHRLLPEMDVALGGHARTRVRYEVVNELWPLGNGRCRLSSPTTDVVVTVALPKVQEASAGASEVQALWQLAGEALGRHEEGHVEIGLEAAERQHRRLQQHALTLVDGSCKALRALLRREALRTELRLRFDQDRYDQRTAFGARQGAVLPRYRESNGPIETSSMRATW